MACLACCCDVNPLAFADVERVEGWGEVVIVMTQRGREGGGSKGRG